MGLAERLGGMTLIEIAERMDEAEFGLWLVEHHLRAEERRDEQLKAQAKALARG